MVHPLAVALRKESVDRNTVDEVQDDEEQTVALRKESVDRNIPVLGRVRFLTMSLSARRAWIEMRKITITVDDVTSLSARRAWIEMLISALWMARSHRRSPQGERG